MRLSKAKISPVRIIIYMLKWWMWRLMDVTGAEGDKCYNHRMIIKLIAHYIPQSLSSLPSTQSALKSHMFDTSMMFDWSSHINIPVKEMRESNNRKCCTFGLVSPLSGKGMCGSSPLQKNIPYIMFWNSKSLADDVVKLFKDLFADEVFQNMKYVTLSFYRAFWLIKLSVIIIFSDRYRKLVIQIYKGFI